MWILEELEREIKVGCVFSMVAVSILPHAEFGPNDHQDEAPHFIIQEYPYFYRPGTDRSEFD